MGVEIERKFLVRNESWRLGATPGVPIRQGYLSGAEDRASARVRREGERASLTVKGPGGLTRAEYEYVIPVAEAEEMLATLCGPVLGKQRHGLRHAGLDWTVDVFEGPLAGLVLAEVELSSADQPVEIPSWAGTEVTDDPAYRNIALAQRVAIPPRVEGLPMTAPPTFSLLPSFLGVSRRDQAGAFAVAGVPLDLGTTNRAGTRDGPRAIRAASRMLVDGAHPVSWREPSDMPIADLGDFAIALGDIPNTHKLIERQAGGIQHLLALGGEHGITLPLLRALSKRVGGPLGLVQFDAHPDTAPDNFGQIFGHGCFLFHAIEEGLVDPARCIQIGIRAPMQRDTWDWTLEHGVTILTAQQVHAMSPEAVAARAREVVGEGPTYLSFDIDALDPAFAPGTGTPEVGGLASWQVQAILRGLGGIDFRGMDVVEVSPAYDVSEITALAAAAVVWEYLALVSGPLER